MNSLDSDTQDALDAGRIIRRDLLVLNLGSGLKGFWSGNGPLVWNSITFKGAGTLLSISSIKQSSELNSEKVVVTADPNLVEEIGANALSNILNETYHRRPASIYTAFFDMDTYDLLSVESTYYGRMDQVLHEVQAGATGTIQLHLQSRFREHSIAGWRVRSDADQKLINPNDNSLRHTAIVGQDAVEVGQIAGNKLGPIQRWMRNNQLKRDHQKFDFL